MNKPKRIHPDDLTTDDLLMFKLYALSKELIKLRDLMVISVDQLNKLNSFRTIVTQVLEEQGVITKESFEKEISAFYGEAMEESLQMMKEERTTFLEKTKEINKLTKQDIQIRTIEDVFDFVEQEYGVEYGPYWDEYLAEA